MPSSTEHTGALVPKVPDIVIIDNDYANGGECDTVEGRQEKTSSTSSLALGRRSLPAVLITTDNSDKRVHFVPEFNQQFTGYLWKVLKFRR